MDRQDSSPQSGDEEEQAIRVSFENLCRDLNMDEDSKSEAWQAFLQISRTYTLEGSYLHWLACALYVSCRKGAIRSSGQIQGNGISLTNGVSLASLLKASDFRLLDFFQKIKKWLDMAKCGNELRKKIELLERNFSVASCIFKKFEPIFSDLFHKPDESPGKAGKGRRRKANPNVLDMLKKFCWILYVRVKGNFPGISDDLVNSYHLLLCCLDLIFLNCITSPQRKEIINPKFRDLPANYMDHEYSAEDAPCLVDSLCRFYDGIVLESKQIRQHHWKPFMKTLFDNKILKGNKETLTGLLEPAVFDNNLKHINQDYDYFVIHVGDFDERIFLGPNFSMELGTPLKTSFSDDEIDRKERFHLRRNLEEHFNRAGSLAPQTPLTGRGYLGEKGPSVSPISTATQSINQLQNLLQGCGPYPSEQLKKVFSECRRNPKEKIANTVTELGRLFIDAYTKLLKSILMTDGQEYSFVSNLLTSYEPLGAPVTGSSAPVDFAKERLRLASTLFYKVLESILISEKKRISEHADFTALLEQEVFIKCLAACCLEIVVFSYNSQREFPWVLDALQLKPYHFYKVIEVMIREEGGLSRDLVKHLNYIEEKILEKLAWETDSPLYDALKQASDVIPSCEDCSFASGTTALQGHSILSAVTPVSSPIITRQSVKQLNGSGKKVPLLTTDDPQTSFAKRNLFGSPTGQAVHTSAAPKGSPRKSSGFSPSKGSSVVGPLNFQGQTIIFQQGKGLAGRLALVMPCPVSPNTTPINSPIKGTTFQGTPRKASGIFGSPTKATKRTRSLDLFFRKVYHLASVRLADLATKLGVDEDLQRKIWTCFEYSLVNKNHLMLDRHLDQLLMCAVYVVSKVTKQDKKFHDIMRCYRTQPQAASNVYRLVLLKRGSPNSSGDSTGSSSKPFTEKPVHSETSRLRSSAEDSTKVKEEGSTEDSQSGDTDSSADDVYGDLIEFYNNVYIKELKDFALRFASNGKSEDAPPLSPLPVRRNQLQSPRKISKNHEIYVSPIKPSSAMRATSPLLYCFDKSPSRKLKDINDMITERRSITPEGSRRRLSLTEDGVGPSPAKRIPESNGITRKINELNKERLPDH